MRLSVLPPSTNITELSFNRAPRSEQRVTLVGVDYPGSNAESFEHAD